MAESLVVLVVLGLLLLVVVVKSLVTVDQATCAVITMFGKYRRIMGPGLHVKIPLIEKVHQRIPVQNQSVELAFQATTQDQANVNFSAMLLYTVSDDTEATITKVAFKFVSAQAFMQALTRTIEGTIRAFVATKRQAEILGLRTEIVSHVKEELDLALDDWGYRLLDLQINDISFGTAITTSMERVVASQNERTAAENEGAALLIRETKRAEAEGAAIKIAAGAEMEAARLRGQGVAAFRREVASGMAQAARATEDAGLDPSFVLFAMWTEALRHVAENGEGNLITLDGSPQGLQQTLRQMMVFSGGLVPRPSPADPGAGAAGGTVVGEPAVGEPAAGEAVAPVAGWYPDPDGSGLRRWWDGTAWSDRYQ